MGRSKGVLPASARSPRAPGGQRAGAQRACGARQVTAGGDAAALQQALASARLALRIFYSLNSPGLTEVRPTGASPLRVPTAGGALRAAGAVRVPCPWWLPWWRVFSCVCSWRLQCWWAVSWVYLWRLQGKGTVRSQLRGRRAFGRRPGVRLRARACRQRAGRARAGVRKDAGRVDGGDAQPAHLRQPRAGGGGP